MHSKIFVAQMDFLLLLGRALHTYGASANSLEAILSNIAQVQFKSECNVFSTPTSLMISLKQDDDEMTQITRTFPGDVNLEKLCLVDDIADDVIDGKSSPEEGAYLIREVMERKKTFGPGLTIMAYSLSAFSISILFATGFYGWILAAVNGLIVGLISTLSSGEERWSKIYDTLAALLVSLLTYYVGSLVGVASINGVIIASLIVLIPGLELTLAVGDLASNHLVTGTARLMRAMTLFLKLSIGVFMANRIANMMGWVPTTLAPNDVSDGLELIAFSILVVSLIILFQMRRRDMLWTYIIGAFGFYVVKFGGKYLDGDLAVLMGGFTIGVCAHAAGRYLNKPVTVMTLPTLILLVPGSLGLKGLTFIIDKQVLLGVESLIHVMFVSMSLVAGLFLGHILISPRRNL